MASFPAVNARQFLAVLTREPLGYQIARQRGSHRHLRAEGRPDLLFSFHDGDTVPPGLVRKYLVKQIGLTDDVALDLLKG